MTRPEPTGRRRLQTPDWDRHTVILLKPDCVTRGLVAPVLAHLDQEVEVVARQQVIVSDAQIFAHYADIVAARDRFGIDVVESLRRTYVGHEVVVALGRGQGPDTAERVRGLLGHYDPARAGSDTIRGQFGTDSLEHARAEGRLIENVIHTSDVGSAELDFGIWFGTSRTDLLTHDPKETTR